MHKANDEVFSNMNCTQNILIAENTDIAFITETWLTKSILDSEILPSNEFNIFRKDREASRGGGVLLAVRSSLFSSIQQIDIPTDLEFVCCEVTTKNDKFILASCYRPPNSNISWCRKFGETLQYLRDVYDQIVIAGDFNLPSIDWNCLENTTGSDELEFTEILNDYFLKQLSVEPTRLNNVLDLIITSSPDRVEVLDIISPNDAGIFTDHAILQFEIKIKPA